MANVFIFFHHPIYVPVGSLKSGTSDLCHELSQPSATNFQNIVAQHKNVAFVIASHDHLYYNPQNPNNVTVGPAHFSGSPPSYVVSGGAGAPLAKFNPAYSGSMYNYLRFTVTGGIVTTQIVPISPPVPGSQSCISTESPPCND
jgi:hypothetical protein